MTRKMKAILVLFFAAEIVNSAKVGVLKSRIADLETQRDIYASRAQNWIDRAVEDEEVIDSLQIRLDETADRKIELTEAGTFFLHGILHRTVRTYLRRRTRNYGQRTAHTGRRHRSGRPVHFSIRYGSVH